MGWRLGSSFAAAAVAQWDESAGILRRLLGPVVGAERCTAMLALRGLEGSETGLETSYLVAGHVEGLGMQRDPEPVASHTQLPERPPTADLAVLA